MNSFGARCNECHCKTDCDRETGECEECMEGWHGPNCQMGKRNMIIIHKDFMYKKNAQLNQMYALI